MVDSVKNYGITGVSSTVELGKQGSKIDASNASVISFKDKDNELIAVAIAEGVDPEHAVALSQLDAADSAKLSYITTTVDYDSGTVTVGNVSANTYIHSVSVEKSAGNWTDVGENTEITVGDTSDSARLFSGFDTTAQVTQDDGHLYSSTDTISITVTQGGASAGSAKVTIWYSGTISDAAIPPSPPSPPSSGTAGVDNVTGYAEMPGPVSPGTELEDFTATVNDPIGFTINNDNLTGVAITGLSASNDAWFAANYVTVPGTYTCTWGPGSTVASSSISVGQINPGQIIFYVQGQSGPATYNYPFTFSV